jgi:hypothetical protein
VISQSWSPARDSLTLEVSGAAGTQYEVGMWNSAQVTSVEGAELVAAKMKTGAESSFRVSIPPNISEPYPREKIIIHFTGKTQ